MTPPPQIDARKLAAMRARTLTAARKAEQDLDDIVNVHHAELWADRVPPAAALRKAADKYLSLLATLDLADTLLTPEALEAANLPPDPEPGTAVVQRGDLALLTRVVRALSLLPPEDGPLARLEAAAAGALPPEVPDGLAAVPGSPPWQPGGLGEDG